MEPPPSNPSPPPPPGSGTTAPNPPSRIPFAILLSLGAMALLAAVVIAGALMLNHSARQYVDATLPIIARDWNEDEILKRASPGLKQNISADELGARLLLYKVRLGDLKKCEGSVGTTSLAYSSGALTLSARYGARADFESDYAIVGFKLIWHGGQWQIQDILVDSPALGTAPR